MLKMKKNPKTAVKLLKIISIVKLLPYKSVIKVKSSIYNLAEIVESRGKNSQNATWFDKKYNKSLIFLRWDFSYLIYKASLFEFCIWFSLFSSTILSFRVRMIKLIAKQTNERNIKIKFMLKFSIMNFYLLIWFILMES
jgi:hypothetical protein